jgi:hypothetical protein
MEVFAALADPIFEPFRDLSLGCDVSLQDLILAGKPE